MVTWVTVLRSLDEDRPATKRLCLGTDGQIEKLGYGKAFRFRCRRDSIASIIELAEFLSLLQTDPYSFVIRGEPLPDVDLSQPVRRLKYQRNGNGPFFRSSSRGEQWVCLDFDAIPCPPTLRPGTDPIGAIKYLVGLLPREFHDVTCWWQWSSGAGIDGWTTLRAHLWYMLDRPIPDIDLRLWAEVGGAPVDASLFETVQPHYTAAPILDGVSDPMPTRSGLLPGLTDVVVLSLPARRQTITRDISGVGLREAAGFETWLGKIGDHEGGLGFHHPIRSAIASYVATADPNEVDRDAIIQRVQEMVAAADPGTHAPNEIQRYQSERYLDDLISGAIRKFSRARRLIDGVAAHFPDEELPPEEARERVAEVLDSFMAPLKILKIF